MEQLKGRLEFSEIQEFALQESLSSEKERPARARGGPTRCRLSSTRSVVSGGGNSEAPLKGYLEVCPRGEVCRANARSDQRWITWGGEVRWPASTGSDPEAIVGGYSPYRLVVRFDTDCGKFKSMMTQRAGPRRPSRRGGGAWSYCPPPRGSPGGYTSGTPAVVSLTTAPDAGSGAGWTAVSGPALARHALRVAPESPLGRWGGRRRRCGRG